MNNTRHFYESGNIRWEVTDKYGYGLDKLMIRDSKLSEVLEDNTSIEVKYTITLKKINAGMLV